jgi:hypothetical protein
MEEKKLATDHHKFRYTFEPSGLYEPDGHSRLGK